MRQAAHVERQRRIQAREERASAQDFQVEADRRARAESEREIHEQATLFFADPIRMLTVCVCVRLVKDPIRIRRITLRQS